MRRASHYFRAHVSARAVQTALNWATAIVVGLVLGALAGAGF